MRKRSYDNAYAISTESSIPPGKSRRTSTKPNAAPGTSLQTASPKHSCQSSQHLSFSLASKLYVTFHIALRMPVVKEMRPPLTRLESTTKGWPFHRPHSASVNTRRARARACAERPAQGRQRLAVSNLSPRGHQRQKRRSEKQNKGTRVYRAFNHGTALRHGARHRDGVVVCPPSAHAPDGALLKGVG